MLWNPNAPKGDWRTLPNAWYADGQGLYRIHDGWKPSDAFVQMHVQNAQMYVDHQVPYLADFLMYVNGEWVLDHGLDYAGPNFWGLGPNTMIVAGLPAMAEFHQVVAQSQDPNNKWFYLAGTTGGQYYHNR